MALRRIDANHTGTGAWTALSATNIWTQKIVFLYSPAATAATFALVGDSSSTSAATAHVSLAVGGSFTIEPPDFRGHQGETYNLANYYANVPSGQVLYVQYEEIYLP